MLKSFLIALAAIFSSGLLYYYSENFHSVWQLMWIAPVPVLIYACKHRFWESAAVAFFAGLFRGFNFLIGEQTLGPQGAFAIYSLEESLEWTLIILLIRYLTRRHNTAIFLYPFAIALWEWLKSIGPVGTFTTISYSQLPVLPIVQIASITGHTGVSFIVSLFASTLSYIVLIYQQKKKRLWIAGCSLALIAGSVIYGFYRIHSYDERSLPSIQTGLASIQSDTKRIFDPANAESLADEYVPLIQNLAQQGAKVVLLPEEMSSITQESRPSLQNKWSQIAKDANAIVILGFREYAGSDIYNIAWLFSEEGNLLGEYKKTHLVPGFEDKLTPGDNELLTFSVDKHPAGIAICRDLDYPNPARLYGEKNTGILFVPAWDFIIDAYYHAQGAFMRGIENGYTIVRSARDGLLTVTSPTGKILAEAPAFHTPSAILSAAAPIALHTSVYARHPSVFIAILGVLFLIGFAATLFAKRTSK